LPALAAWVMPQGRRMRFPARIQSGQDTRMQLVRPVRYGWVAFCCRCARAVNMLVSGQCNNIDCKFRHVDPRSRIRECPWYIRGFCKLGTTNAASPKANSCCTSTHQVQAAHTSMSKRSPVNFTSLAFVPKAPSASLSSTSTYPPIIFSIYCPLISQRIL